MSYFLFCVFSIGMVVNLLGISQFSKTYIRQLFIHPMPRLSAQIEIFTSLDDPFLKSPLVRLSCFKCAASSVVSPVLSIVSKCACNNSAHFYINIFYTYQITSPKQQIQLRLLLVIHNSVSLARSELYLVK